MYAHCVVRQRIRMFSSARGSSYIISFLHPYLYAFTHAGAHATPPGPSMHPYPHPDNYIYTCQPLSPLRKGPPPIEPFQTTAVGW
jgi:hypothetical protein